MNKKPLKKRSQTDWGKIDGLRDKDIDYSDIPKLNQDFFKNTVLRMPEKKVAVTMRIDREVLQWFRSQGGGYQTRINALLKAYMEAHTH